MSLLVKICGLSTPASVDAAIKAGADMVGFVFFARSPRNVSIEAAAALASRARGRAGIVALTVDAEDAALADIVAALRPDLLQLHGRESPERLAHLRALFGVPLMKVIGVAVRSDLAATQAYGNADRFLLDTKPPADAALPGGNGLSFDWTMLEGFNAQAPIMLSGGLDSDNVAEAIRVARPDGVDVSSGVERAPGLKDEAKIAAFIRAARVAET
ncbi:phosphoribosylanthranilate isomerase [Rhizobiales bacterium GAS191]|jgi:phosphoribosylanthranilate isomerase|nr:phosphoribosylanthranilate isomerase [Rhizobiales bacterium GAS113]SEC13528.1 phosphoribosylanthranilate isomerase [Rhizobiales bacterium GAS188]SED09338.1 phosphoribosylanthranilate isomerase [Rhizobiales bacterium GAS191]